MDRLARFGDRFAIARAILRETGLPARGNASSEFPPA